MRRSWGRVSLVALASALVVVGIAALLSGHLAGPVPGASVATPDTPGDACLSPPATWDPLHASATQIASYGLPPRPEGNPTEVAKWVDIVSHAKHRVCGPGQVGNPVPPTPSGQELGATALIEFAPGTTYTAALRTVTDLGLELAGFPCPGGEVIAQGTPTFWQDWTPLAHPDDFSDAFALSVFATPLAPRDWLHAALATRGVKDVRTDLSVNCPAIFFVTPPAGTPLALGASLGTSPPPVYVRLTFGAGVNYDAALLAISNLGLRLADPCHEQEVASGRGFAWQPAGQQNAYATSHILMLATSPVASSVWQAQTRALAGVTAVQVDPPITCS